jgi:predicted nuclease with TOPRIM domain
MKADKTETQSRNELYRQIEELRMKQEQVRDKLKQLQSAEDSAWEDMKTGVEKSWGELKSAFSQASARFKNT